MVMPLGHQCAGVLAHSGINQFSCTCTTLPKCKYHLVLSRTRSVWIRNVFCNYKKKHKSSLMSRFWADKCRIMSHYYICWPALCHSAGYWGLIATLTRTIPSLSSSNDPFSWDNGVYMLTWLTLTIKEKSTALPLLPFRLFPICFFWIYSRSWSLPKKGFSCFVYL